MLALSSTVPRAGTSGGSRPLRIGVPPCLGTLRARLAKGGEWPTGELVPDGEGSAAMQVLRHPSLGPQPLPGSALRARSHHHQHDARNAASHHHPHDVLDAAIHALLHLLGDVGPGVEVLQSYVWAMCRGRGQGTSLSMGRAFLQGMAGGQGLGPRGSGSTQPAGWRAATHSAGTRPAAGPVPTGWLSAH